MSLSAVQQTTVTTALKGPFAGMLVRTRPFDAITAYSKDASADKTDDPLGGDAQIDANQVQWGEPLYFDNWKNKTVKPTKAAAADRHIHGFLIHQATEDGKQGPEQTLAVLRKGVIWVPSTIIEGTPAAGSNVIWDVSEGKLSTAAAATGDITFYGLNFTGQESGSGTDKIYELEVNLPNYKVTA